MSDSALKTSPDVGTVSGLARRYWHRNIILMTSLLAIWAFVGLGCGVLFAGWLNQFNLPGTGYPLGFWFAQQGSIVVFVLLVLTYATVMNRIDQRHHQDLEKLRAKDEKGGKE